MAGKGYATEALVALFDTAFTQLGLRRLHARIDETPHTWRRSGSPSGSACVARRCWSRTSEFKGRWITEVDYGLLDREWRG